MKIGIFGPGITEIDDILAKQLSNPGKVETIIIGPNFKDIKSKIGNIDVLHVLYGVGDLTFLTLVYAKILRKKTVCHWIGSDVLELSSKKWKLLKRLQNLLIDMHFAVSETLVEELKAEGITALLVPIIPEDISMKEGISELPENFTVLSYLPDSRHEFYGSEIVRRLASEFPGISFLIVSGTEEKQERRPNIKYLGWQNNMEPIFDQSTVLLRVPKHDGLSLIVLEALAKGRHVIWTTKFPFCYHAKSYGEVKSALIKIHANPSLNYEGSKYVLENFNEKKIMPKYIEIYAKLLKNKKKVFESSP